MTDPIPPRTDDEIAAAYQRFAEHGTCCDHSRGAHRPDGSCALVGIGSCSCPGWQATDPLAVLWPDAPVGRYCTQLGCTGDHTDDDPACLTPDDDVIDAEVLSSGDPLTDVVHDVLARHYPADIEGRWLDCRDELISAVRAWAAGALGIHPDPS
jgi:hypothetical protein